MNLFKKNFFINSLTKYITIANILLAICMFFLVFVVYQNLPNFMKYEFSFLCWLFLIVLLFLFSLIIVFFLKSNIKNWMAGILFFLIIIILGIEATLPIEPLIPIVNIPIFADGKFPRQSDRRSRLQVIRDYRKQKIDVYPALEPSDFCKEGSAPISIGGHILLPLTGLANVKTLFDNESGVWQDYVSDEHGFNNPKGLYVPGQVDIMILGSSYAQGMGVKQNENIAGILREKYPHTISLGVKGTAPLSHFAIFQEYVERLKPKILIWIYYEQSEISTFDWELKQPLIAAYLEPKYRQNLYDLPKSVLDPVLKDWLEKKELSFGKEQQVKRSIQDVKQRIKKTFKLDRMLTLYGFHSLKKEYAILHPTLYHLWPTGNANMMHLFLLKYVDARMKSWGGKLFVVAIPSKLRVKEGVTNPNYDYSSTRNAQLSGIESLKIPLIDLYPVQLSHTDPLSLHRYRRWGHYTVDGYRFISNAIINAIGESYLKDFLAHR